MSSDLTIKRVDKSRLPEVDLEQPGFGEIFSDHMVEAEYRDGSWSEPVIKPYGSIEITPAYNVLHYAQSIFEGTKAFRGDEDTVHLFRPLMNFERMKRSCERMCIPEIDRDLFMGTLEQLLKLDHRWIPEKSGNALYIRPLAFAFQPVISAKVSDIYRFYIITSPVGAYYAEPVRLTTTETYIRAARGGTGNIKAAGNYGTSMYPARLAQQEGFDQILWLDANEHRYIEEVGTMNIFFKIAGTLVTAPLEGTILPGVTRDSVIQLAESWDLDVEVRKVTIDEVMEAGRNGTLEEVFGAGTAAVISPVREIHHEGESVTIHEESRGPLGQRLYDAITGIQTGKLDDPFGWIYPVDVS